MIEAAGVEEWRFALIVLFFVIGGMVKGATGFGLPLVTVSLTPLIAPVDLALALNTLVIPITNVVQIWMAGNVWSNLKVCAPVIFGLCVTVLAGAWLVASISPTLLGMMLGVLLIIFTLLSLSAPKFRLSPRQDKPAAIAAGLLGGAVAAAITAPGPVFAMYLVSKGLDRRDLICAMGICMCSVGLLISGSFALVGLLDGPRAILSAAMAIPGFAGMWLGDRLARHLSVDGFRRVILGALLVLGAFHIMRALV
jgi:uncharacterized membrane protein YfcA